MLRPWRGSTNSGKTSVSHKAQCFPGSLSLSHFGAQLCNATSLSRDELMLWDSSTPLLSLTAGAFLWLWTAALVVISGWALYRSCGCIRRLLCCRKKESESETAWIWLSSLGNSTWRGAHGRDELLAMQAQVEAIADSQRLERVSNAIKLGVFAIPLFISQNVRVAHDLFKAHDNEYLLYRSSVGFMVLIELMAIIFYFRPATLSKRALQVGYAILMVRSVYDDIVSARDLDEAGRELSFLPDEYKIIITHILNLWF